MNADVFTTWFLGNMFMDRYVIVHDMEGADDIGGQYKPRIGLYDKYAHKSKADEVEATSFLQWTETQVFWLEINKYYI